MLLELLREKSDGGGLKVAVQVLSAPIVTTPSPQSALPDQPEKMKPESGVAVKVTEEPEEKEAEHVEPQLMPEGLEVIMPEPVPPLVTVRVLFTGAGE